MSHTITIETRISNDVLQKDNLNDALTAMASGFCHAKYSMWSMRMRSEAINKPQFMNKFGLSSRQFNSVKTEVDGLIQSQTSNIKRYIEEDKQRLKRAQKTLERTTAKVKEADVSKTDSEKYAKLVRDKHGSLRRVALLRSRIGRRENMLESGKLSVCFGSKDLFHKQFELEENGYENHAAWRRDFLTARNTDYFSKGAKDEAGGNSSATITRTDDGRYKIRLKTLTGLEDKHARFIEIPALTFPYKASLLDAAIEANQARIAAWTGETSKLEARHSANIALMRQQQRGYIEYLQRNGESQANIAKVEEKQAKRLEQFSQPTKNNLLKDFGQALSYRLKKDNKGWRILVSVPVLGADEIISDKRRGGIGVDLNDKHLSMTHIDSKGNKLASQDLYFRDADLISSKQTETRLAESVKTIVERARQYKVPVLIENLNFTRARAKPSADKAFNRAVSSMITSKFRALITLRCFEAGIEVIEVNPAYTSFIGRLKYGCQHDHNTHQAAAMVIARRGLGFCDTRLPRIINIKVKHHHCRFILPEDKLKTAGHGELKPIKQLFDAWQKDIFHKIKHHLPITSIEQDVPF